MPAPRRFYDRPGLMVETYDAHQAASLPGTSVAGDVEWYVRRCRAWGGPVLEGGCGTGRVLWPLADAGLRVTGLDRSAPMLRVAERKRRQRPPATARRATLVRGDLAGFDLGRRRFRVALVPFRTFQSLLTSKDQRSSLAAFHRHLVPGGRLVLDLFDPALHWCLPGAAPPRLARPPFPGTTPGTEVRVRVLTRENDPFLQVLTEEWSLEERDASGALLREERYVLRMRWTYRHELRHLLELEGFDVEEEFSDFRESPPRYGGDILVVARKR